MRIGALFVTIVAGAGAFAGIARAEDHPLPPVNERPPTIGGNASDGELLVGASGFWGGTPPLRYNYRWDRCNTASCTSTGVTSSIYRLGSADVGYRMRLVETVSNAAGSVAATSLQSAAVQPKRLSPFPKVAIGGFLTSTGVQLSQLAALRVPRGSTARITCGGRGCPFRRAGRRVYRGSVIFRTMLGRPLHAGTVIEIRLTKRNLIGKYTRFRVRRGRKPSRIDRCLIPGERGPVHCPRGRR